MLPVVVVFVLDPILVLGNQKTVDLIAARVYIQRRLTIGTSLIFSSFVKKSQKIIFLIELFIGLNRVKVIHCCNHILLFFF